MRTRQALTLVEVTVATAIFGGMLVVVLEAMVYMRNLAATVEDVDVLEEQAANARRAITRDLANSGWFYCWPGANGRRFYPQIHFHEQLAWHRSEITPPPSVTLPFDPKTGRNDPTPFNASVTQNLATVFGDAMVFTRLQPEGSLLTDQPGPPNAAIVNFTQAKPVRLDQFPHARPVQGLVIYPDAVDQSELTSVVWETTPEKTGTKVLGFYSDSNVRLFSYRVVPDPRTGRGALVRFYSNPDSGDRNNEATWVQDEVIAQDVVRMRIYSFEMSTWYGGDDTNRDFTVNEASGMTNNQLRFSIDFARNLEQLDPETSIDIRDRRNTSRSGDAKQRVSTVKTLQFTVGLRSITNALDQ